LIFFIPYLVTILLGGHCFQRRARLLMYDAMEALV
jgi:hypothetical protein